MKKFIAKFVCAAALFAAVLAPTAAKATPISGSVAIAGNDTFTPTSITFNPATGVVLAASTLTGVPPFSTISLGSIANFATASGVDLFDNGTTKFVLNGPVFVDAAIDGTYLLIHGTGVFSTTLAGYTSTTGTFNLSSNQNGTISFSLDSSVAATPEPSSLLLMGTGLVGAAGVLMMRRRRNVVDMSMAA